MPRQIFRCPDHGEFEVTLLFMDDVPKRTFCQAWVPDTTDLADNQRYHLCEKESPWVPSVPNFIGGPTTGAKK